jgi:hypothetical protein
MVRCRRGSTGAREKGGGESPSKEIGKRNPVGLYFRFETAYRVIRMTLSTQPQEH